MNYLKTYAAAIGTVLLGVYGYLGDGVMSLPDWINAALLALGTIGVWYFSNTTVQKYAKFVAVVLTGVLAQVLVVLPGGINSQEVVSLVIAGLTAAGVILVPNKPAPRGSRRSPGTFRPAGRMTAPGTIVLSHIRGPLGVLIRIGQLLNGDASEFTHVLVALDDGSAVAAYPRGAQIVFLDDEAVEHGPLGYVRIPQTPEQTAEVVRIARTMVGTPYGWLDYLVLAAVRLGIPSERLRKFVASGKSMICSQMADEIFGRAGIQIFDDGRPAGDVTPGDFAELALERSY